MIKKRVSKKKKLLSVVKSAPPGSGLKSVSMRSDYFARFRYSLEEMLIILQSEPVRSLQINSQTREILDDLGYWSLVRAEEGQGFTFSADLEAQLVAQCEYLQRSLTYKVGDKVWVKKYDNTYVQAQIIDHVNSEDSDFYAVEIDSDSIKETQIYSKFELDQINQIGCFLPQDVFDSELIDWDNDLIWKKRLEDFKVKMAAKNFHIDFRKSAEEILVKINELTADILAYFKITIGSSRQIGRGLGMRSCGEGTSLDQYLVYLSAIQALGHVYGLKLTDIDNLANEFFNEVNKQQISLACFKSIAEVADKLVARGPLAAASSQQAIKSIEIDKASRKAVVENYLTFKNLNMRRSLLRAISESAIFANIVQFSANSI